MRGIRHRSIGFLIAMLLSAPGFGTAHAEGRLTLSWDRPAGPGQPPIARREYSGPGTYDLYVTLTGQSDPVRIFAIYLQVNVANEGCPTSVPFPAAWRYDEQGCRRRGACYVGGGMIDDTSPQQSKVESVTSMSFEPGPKRLRMLFAQAYPLPLVMPDPDQSYVLGRFRFEQTGMCGGEGDSLAIALVQAEWAGECQCEEFEWLGVGETFAIWNGSPVAGDCASAPAAVTPLANAVLGFDIDPNLAACDLPVAVYPRTWGQVKAAYR